jgi:hypothetical protein
MVGGRDSAFREILNRVTPYLSAAETSCRPELEDAK